MISIHVPAGAQVPNIGKELTSARQIKDRVTKVSTISGLNKIAQYL